MPNLLFNQFDGNSYSSYYGDINPSINKELNLNGNKIINLPTPASNSEPATKEYVDNRAGKKLIESVNIAGTLDYINNEAEKSFTKELNLSTVDALGIRLTFNNDLICRNNSGSDQYFSISCICELARFNTIYRNSVVKLFNAGDSIFIPLLFCAGSLDDKLGSDYVPQVMINSNGFSRFSSGQYFPYLGYSKMKITPKVSLDSYGIQNSTFSYDITFDLYTIKF